jgi:hypothetical protein
MKPEILPVLASLFLVGCGTVELFDSECPPEYITVNRTEFFSRGPAQAAPPQKIEKDTLLNVLKKDSGYAFVRLNDNRTGYVDFDELRPAPPVAPDVPFDPMIVEEIVEVPLPDFQIAPEEIPEKHRTR